MIVLTIIAILIVSLLLVMGTHKVIAMMAGHRVTRLYIFYTEDNLLFSCFMGMSTILFTIYLILTSLAYINWIR